MSNRTALVEFEAGVTTPGAIYSFGSRYVIPYFQRGFVWGDEQLDRFWDDVIALTSEESATRFLGAFVLKPKKAGSSFDLQEFWVVDGQQRLTTLYLFNVALAVTCQREHRNPDDPSSELVTFADYADDIARSRLLSTRSRTRNQPLLSPSINDGYQFTQILNNLENPKPEFPASYARQEGTERLLNAYHYLLDKVESFCLNPMSGVLDITQLEKLQRAVEGNMQLVEIRLSEDMDENEIFERLNFDGVDLDPLDRIRNEVFTGLEISEMDSIYREKWQPFENTFPLDESDKPTVPNYFYPLALILDINTTKQTVIQVLRTHWDANLNDAGYGANRSLAIIDDLSKYKPMFCALVSPAQDWFAEKWPAELREVLLTLKSMKKAFPTSSYPFIMRLLYELKRETVLVDHVVEDLRQIEAFLVRRSFAGMEPTGLHAVFKRLWSNSEGDPERVFKALNASITIFFPKDDDFEKAIKTGNLYDRKLCKFIVGEYERSLKRGDPYRNEIDFDVDHVMPKDETLWARAGIVTEQDHQRLLNTWANLVPLSKEANSSKKNRTFEATKEMLETETHFKTTQKLARGFSEWTPKQIEERAETLAEFAVKRWPRPEYDE